MSDRGSEKDGKEEKEGEEVGKQGIGAKGEDEVDF
jgi:hypothetical protein